MITCGHCGCTLVGEIKKGKYIYYRCTHYKTDCNEPYVREEVLEEKFADILRMLRFDEEVLEWIRTALKEGHDDETRYHREIVDKLQKEYKRLEQRLEAMYVDNLDGKIGERDHISAVSPPLSPVVAFAFPFGPRPAPQTDGSDRGT